MSGLSLQALAWPSFQQLEVTWDAERALCKAYMCPKPRPCFNLHLLNELATYVQSIRNGFDPSRAVRYAVLASKIPGVFNLGGDLSLFRALIHSQDRAALLNYGKQCVDNLHAWHRNCDGPITSIALVQGDALGGGFEAALSASVLIAEESSRFGFPEILFNLFPGMGAFSFLSRKIGRRSAEEMIISGTIYSARQLYDLGIIDVITPDGTGEAALNSFVQKHSKSITGRQGFERARNVIDGIPYEELLRVVEIWADTALRLQDRDLKVMDRLIRAQARSVEPRAEETNIYPLRTAIQ